MEKTTSQGRGAASEDTHAVWVQDDTHAINVSCKHTVLMEPAYDPRETVELILQIRTGTTLHVLVSGSRRQSRHRLLGFGLERRRQRQLDDQESVLLKLNIHARMGPARKTPRGQGRKAAAKTTINA